MELPPTWKTVSIDASATTAGNAKELDQSPGAPSRLCVPLSSSLFVPYFSPVLLADTGTRLCTAALTALAPRPTRWRTSTACLGRP